MNNRKLTLLYERLSREDERESESASIENQKKFLEDYAGRNGFPNCVHLSDDGWSGTRWDRPGILRMLDELDGGNVAVVLTKDMSRLGRDYLRVELLLEKFRDRGVRFIAVNDNVDTDKGLDDFTPFRNIINEWVARDTSRKIRAIFGAITAEGGHVTGAVPYGYFRDPDDRRRWRVDEEAAAVVRRIFKSVIDGEGVSEIARKLCAENIPTPGAHWEKAGAGMRKYPGSDPVRWSAATVSGILKKEEYMGWAVLNKSFRETHKSKRQKTALDDRLIFKNAHPALVDEETWEVVRRLRETRRRPRKHGGDANPLTGVLYCADCGNKMYHKRGTKGEGLMPHNEYVCSSYRSLSESCSCHFIRVQRAEEIILEEIRRTVKYARENETDFAERVLKNTVARKEIEIRENRKKLAELKQRRDETGFLIKKLYEAYASEKISEKHFTRLLEGYDAEQEKLEKETAAMQLAADAAKSAVAGVDKFIALAKKHADPSGFSAALLNEFVDKVVVFEAERKNGTREQRVDVCFRYIGKFDLPGNETPGEKDKKSPRRKPRTQRERDYDRARYAKIRASRTAAALALRASVLKGTSFEL